MKLIVFLLFVVCNLLVANVDAETIRTVSTDVTTTSDDEKLKVDASGGNRIITLVRCTSANRVHQDIKKIDNTTNTVTVDPYGTQTIDGATTFVLTNEKNNVGVKCDGANWILLYGTGETIVGSISGTFLQQVQNEGSNLTAASRINFIGTPINCVYNAGVIDCTVSASSVFFQTVQDESVDLAQQSKLNFLGAGVNCVSDGVDSVDCTIAGGSASLPVVDTTSIVEGSADNTKEARFEVDGLTTGTVRVITVPDADLTLAGQNLANVFTLQQTIDTATPIQFEGATADANETTISVTDPTADRTVTIGNADSTTVKPSTCSGTDKVEGVDADGDLVCDADNTGSVDVNAWFAQRAFIWCAPGSATMVCTGLVGTVSTTGTLATVFDPKGITMTTATTNNAIAGVVSGPVVVYGTCTYGYTARVRIAIDSSGIGTRRMWIGLFRNGATFANIGGLSTSSASASWGFMALGYDTGGASSTANWHKCAGQGDVGGGDSTLTCTDTGVAVSSTNGTVYELKIVNPGSGGASTFYINDVSVGTITDQPLNCNLAFLGATITNLSAGTARSVTLYSMTWDMPYRSY